MPLPEMKMTQAQKRRRFFCVCDILWFELIGLGRFKKSILILYQNGAEINEK